MISDLLTYLTVAELERLLSPELGREDADVALATLNSRLTPPPESEPPAEMSGADPGYDQLAERHLLDEYLRLSVDETEQISSRVHEWLLERLSQVPELLVDRRVVEQLMVLWFLFPNSLVQHASVGLLLRTDHLAREREEPRSVTSVAAIWQRIEQDQGRQEYDRFASIRALADELIDYLDVLPTEAERALADMVRDNRQDRLYGYLDNWAQRLGEQAGRRVRAALDQDQPG